VKVSGVVLFFKFHSKGCPPTGIYLNMKIASIIRRGGGKNEKRLFRSLNGGPKPRLGARLGLKLGPGLRQGLGPELGTMHGQRRVGTTAIVYLNVRMLYAAPKKPR